MPIIGEREPDGVWTTRRSEMRAALKAALQRVPWKLVERDDFDANMGLKLNDEMATDLEILTAWKKLLPTNRRGWRVLFIRCHDLLNQEETAKKMGYSVASVRRWEAEALDKMGERIYPPSSSPNYTAVK